MFLKKLMAGAAFVGAAAILTSCGYVNGLLASKIRLVGVSVVDPREIRDPGNALGDRTPYTMLRIDFVTNDDYQDIARRRGYAVGPMIAACGQAEFGRDRRYDFFGDIYDEGAMVNAARPEGVGADYGATRGLKDYHLYLSPRRIYRDPEKEAVDALDSYSYDLVKEPEDVCFHIHIGPYEDVFGVGYATNIVRIPSAMLLAAFRRAKLRCADDETYCKRLPPTGQ